MSVRRAAQGGQSSGAGSPTYVSITAGHYTPESMAKAITEAFKKGEYKHCCRDANISGCDEHSQPEEYVFIHPIKQLENSVRRFPPS